MDNPFASEHELYTIELDDLSLETIRRVSRVLGLSSSLRTERKGIVIVDKVTKLAWQAARSTVPIDTGELREAIKIVRPSARPFNPIGRVFINGSIHKTSTGVFKPTNAGLGAILNRIPQRRSRTSYAENPFNPASSSTSQDWIEEATRQLLREIRVLVSRGGLFDG
jgi:hypothetical protein